MAGEATVNELKAKIEGKLRIITISAGVLKGFLWNFRALAEAVLFFYVFFTRVMTQLTVLPVVSHCSSEQQMAVTCQDLLQCTNKVREEEWHVGNLDVNNIDGL